MANARDELRKYVNLLADSWTPRETTDGRVEWLYGLVRAEVLREAAEKLEGIADLVEAKVADYYGAASGIGPGSADMVREAAGTLRSMVAEPTTP